MRQTCFLRVTELLLWIALLHPFSSAQEAYRILHRYPHDPEAFTQGLAYLDGHLYESTGLNGRSSLRMVDLESGRVLQQVPLANQYFGEGLAAWNDTLIQLTWQSHVAFIYDRFSFRLLRTVPCPYEGWGLTQDGHSLILSDGSPVLHFLDPVTFRERRHIMVKDHGKPVFNLNELEFAHGSIYANVWHQMKIARIAPKTGKVTGWIDLTNLLPGADQHDPEAVLNGIAFDPIRCSFFVTGKLWPYLFEIEVPVSSDKVHDSRSIPPNQTYP